MTSTAIDIQKVNIKFGLKHGDGVDWDFLLAIFCRWREEEGEDLIDLADYAHVPEGPSCILVSKRWQFGIDFARGSGLGRDGGWVGVLLSSRSHLDGDLTNRLSNVAGSCLEKGKRLLGESEAPDGVEILTGELDVVFNDRLLVPNTEASDEIVRPDVEALAKRLYGDGAYEIVRDADPARRLGYAIRARTSPDLDAAIQSLS